MKRAYQWILMICIMMFLTMCAEAGEGMKIGEVLDNCPVYTLPGEADASSMLSKGTMVEIAFCMAFGEENWSFVSSKDGVYGYVQSAYIRDMSAAYNRVGQVITFGRYEQDNNPDNGPEEIEWIVLDAKDGKNLLLSKYGLDAKAYDDYNRNGTWRNCSLRSWLNSAFMDAAFSDEERAAIAQTVVDNGDEQNYNGYDTDGGTNTDDWLFLLSYHEVFELYYEAEFIRKCIPTKYAIAQGAWNTQDTQNNGDKIGWWWLRSPGLDQHNAMRMTYTGDRGCYNINNCTGCLRPAFWADLLQ